MCQYCCFLRTPSAFSFELVLSIARARSHANDNLNLILLINMAIRQMNSIIERPCIWSACVLMTSSGNLQWPSPPESLNSVAHCHRGKVCAQGTNTSKTFFPFLYRICALEGKCFQGEPFPCKRKSRGKVAH